MNRLQTLLILWASCLLGYNQAAVQESLRFTQVIFRHGDRTPTEDFPSNPYGAEDWPNGFKQLTQLGMRQNRDLGKFIRTRYDGYLNSTYVTNEIYIRSSDTDRTLMSASALLAGLYPPQGFQVWDPQIPWQPIPVHTVPLEDDIEMTIDVQCSKYNGYYVDALLSDDATQLYEDNKEIIDNVSANAGWTVPLLPNVWNVFDPLFCMTNHPELGMSMPDWVSPDVYSWLDNFNDEYYVYKEYTPAMRLLHSGPFLRMLTMRLQEFTEGTETRKMLLYSSHDSMLASIMIALGIWDHLKPPFAAALSFELHEPQPDNYTVQVYYKNDTVDNPMGEPMQATIPGCGFDCPLDKFLDLLQPLVYKGSVQDWRAECDGIEHGISGAIIAVSVLAVCFIFVLGGIITFALMRRRSTSNYESI